MDWTESDYSQRTAMRLARAGALVRVVASDDACEVCNALTARTYTPSEVPRLPIRGCMREQCRCWFEAVDPETELSVSQLVERGVHALKAGRRDLAEKILRQVVSLDEMNEMGWLWLSGVVTDAEKVACLEKVLAINPRNKHAQAGLQVLHKTPTAQVHEPAVPAREEALPAPPKPQETESVHAEAPRPIAPAAGDAKTPVPPLQAGETDATSADELPPEVDSLRAERRVIIEQWAEFVAFAIEIDPNMLLVQAQAFLQKLQRLNQQASALLPNDGSSAKMRLDELLLQWSESDEIGEALAEVIQEYRSRDNSAPNWQPMHDALGQLGRQVLEHRGQLREQIAAAGGSVAG